MRKLLLPLLLAALPLLASDAEPFRANDTVCYVGDSITHGGTYHSIVTLYYVTRFPSRTMHFYNEGIGGDRASTIMSDERYRLNVDILGKKPTVASIMLGMNDVGRGDYDAGKSGPDIEARRAASLATYHDNMQKLIEALHNSGARLILITPSIYEEEPKFSVPGDPAPDTVGVNAALGKCGVQVRDFAKQFHAGVADFYGTMNTVNDEQRKTDPLFSVVGPNRVHPGPIGHFVMAYAFLVAQDLPREVATISVNAHKKKAEHEVNCKVEHIAAHKTGIEFDALENALPFVVPDEAKPALKLVPFEGRFNQEVVKVDGLKKGSYEFKIDQSVIGSYSAEELAKGVDIAENPATPQYQQSEAVTKLNTDRTKTAARIRDIVAVKYPMSRAKFDVLNRDELLKRLQDQVANAKTHDAAYNRLAATLADTQEPGKLDAQYEDLLAAMYKAAQPRSHHFSLEKK
ncbi:MAG TPA: SGNH/GDSL hydrolase family protein [Bryobacteraceae bacterium]|jgi:lysophospholipase L1-like esterase